jgi:hypothetical protein
MTSGWEIRVARSVEWSIGRAPGMGPRRNAPEADVEKLRGVIKEPRFMDAEEVTGLRRAAEQELNIMEAARTTNKTKAEHLKVSLRLLTFGTGFLAIAVVAIAMRIILD